MLSGHLGTQTFLDGVANYLKSHAYRNATTNDLWAALSQASGKNITEFMVSLSHILRETIRKPSRGMFWGAKALFRTGRYITKSINHHGRWFETVKLPCNDENDFGKRRVSAMLRAHKARNLEQWELWQ